MMVGVGLEEMFWRSGNVLRNYFKNQEILSLSLLISLILEPSHSGNFDDIFQLELSPQQLRTGISVIA